MVQIVCENLAGLGASRIIFVVRKEDIDGFALADVLRLLAPGCEMIVSERPTGGAACSALMAIKYINNDDPLVIANGDQFLDIEVADFLADARRRKLDGSMITFRSIHPKWSFAKLDDEGFVMETAEKRPISTHATAGIYYFARGRDFVEAAQAMIRKDARVMDQFFICPSYNELVLQGKKIGIYEIDKQAMLPLSTPEEVKAFEQHETVTTHA
jgi:dTDP-glucose pyrophosphorylase